MDQLTLCNLALSHLGTQNSLASLDETSTEAFQCKIFYQQALENALYANDWAFSGRTAILALSGTAPPQWTYQYALPADCLRCRRIVNPDEYRRGRHDLGRSNMPQPGAYPIRMSRALGADIYGNQIPVLLTDQPKAALEYSARVSNPDLWEPGFAAAFSWQLAAELAMPLTGSAQLQGAMMQGMAQALAQAKASDANEQFFNYTVEPDWIACRGGYSHPRSPIDRGY